MRRLFCIASVITLASCGVSRPPAVTSAPSDTTTRPLLTPATDLTGSWATGDSNEPAAGPIVLRPSCAYNPAVWIIQQEGSSLKAWTFPESFNQGIVRNGPGLARVTPATGTISGYDVSIADGDVRFELTFDATTGHLRGTRNGKPFWAARQSIVRAEGCPGIP